MSSTRTFQYSTPVDQRTRPWVMPAFSISSGAISDDTVVRGWAHRQARDVEGIAATPKVSSVYCEKQSAR